MRKVNFDFPISNAAIWQGQLHVTANVDGHDVEVTNVIHEDHNGHKSNITALVEEWLGSFYDDLCEAAINNSCNTDEDYTTSVYGQTN
jgi:hypothetical protein